MLSVLRFLCLAVAPDGFIGGRAPDLESYLQNPDVVVLENRGVEQNILSLAGDTGNCTYGCLTA